MRKLNKKSFKIVDCDEQYWESVREMRNHKDNKKGFVEQSYITKKNQKEYMQIYSPLYKVCIHKDECIGYIGIVENDLRICTHPKYHGQGVASWMLEHFQKDYRGVFVKTKLDNVNSQIMFLKNGWTPCSCDERFLYFDRKKR